MHMVNTRASEAGACNGNFLFKNADGGDQIISRLAHQSQIYTHYSESTE